MPLYEYYCKDCNNIFTEMRNLSEYNKPADCPICSGVAERVVVSAPRLNTMRADTRKAHQVNERSAHEPKMSHSHGHTCGAGCNHHHHHKSSSNEDRSKLKQQNGKRPWMLGH